MEDPGKSDKDLRWVGHYTQLSKANDHALVILAMGHGYYLAKGDTGYDLFTSGEDLEHIHQQLRRFDEENQHWPPVWKDVESLTKVPLWPLLVYGAFLSCVYALQHHYSGLDIQQLGAMDAQAVLDQAQWWRVWTALTLHADAAHLIGNIGMGSVIAIPLMQRFGPGLGWLLTVVAAGLGNSLNALLHMGEAFRAIGASTAVFASVGLLVGHRFILLFKERSKLDSRSVFFPVFAGFFLLAWWGSSGVNTDIFGHALGLIAGMLVGAMLFALKESVRKSGRVQGVSGVALLLLFSICWVLAITAES